MLDKTGCLASKKFFSDFMPWFNPVLAHYVVREFAKNASVIVDMGMGPGYLVMELSKLTGAKILGLDYNPNMLEVAHATLLEHKIDTTQISLHLEDVHNLSLASNSVDCVVSYSCFHHWDNPIQGLKECMRILKKGGVLLLLDVLPIDDIILTNLKENITDEAVYAIIQKAVLEAYSMKAVEAFLKQADIKNYTIGPAILPEVDLMANIDLLFEQQLFKHYTRDNALSWKLVVIK